jgi:hypothetical protein
MRARCSRRPLVRALLADLPDAAVHRASSNARSARLRTLHAPGAGSHAHSSSDSSASASASTIQEKPSWPPTMAIALGRSRIDQSKSAIAASRCSRCVALARLSQAGCGCWSPTARDDWAGRAPSFLLSQAWRRPRAAGADTAGPRWAPARTGYGRRRPADEPCQGSRPAPARPSLCLPNRLPTPARRFQPASAIRSSARLNRRCEGHLQRGAAWARSNLLPIRCWSASRLDSHRRRKDAGPGRLASSLAPNYQLRDEEPAAGPVCRSSGLAIVWLGSGWLVESAHRLSGLSHTASM